MKKAKIVLANTNKCLVLSYSVVGMAKVHTLLAVSILSAILSIMLVSGNIESSTLDNDLQNLESLNQYEPLSLTNHPSTVEDKPLSGVISVPFDSKFLKYKEDKVRSWISVFGKLYDKYPEAKRIKIEQKYDDGETFSLIANSKDIVLVLNKEISISEFSSRLLIDGEYRSNPVSNEVVFRNSNL